MRLLLLPGMNGTTDLFAGFLDALPGHIRAEPVGYWTSRVQGYSELLDELPAPLTPTAVLGESFSGPLSILYAARYPEQVKALILVGTFARCPWPVPPFLSALIRPTIFRRPAPAWLVRALMYGSDASEDEVARFQACLAGVDAPVLARRVAEVIRVDVRSTFASLRVPVLYLAGRRDHLVRGWNVAGLRRVRTDLQVTSLDAPHLILQRRPAEAAAEVTRFVAENLAKSL